MRFSIVIPVYNVADYLEKCVQSVLDNRYPDCEILLVDDGSTDGKSGALCDKIAGQHPELIRVIHQENRGLGGARNTGLEAARGEYLFFIDSDDYISPNSLRVLSNAIDKTHADVYSFGMYVDDGAGRLQKTATSKHYDAPFSLTDQPDFLFALPAAWARIWRRELFLTQEIRYPSRVWYEDIRTSTKLFALAGSIVTLPDCLYYYLCRPGSITRNSNVSRNREILNAFDDILTWFEARGLRESYEDELCRLAIDHILLAGSVRVLRIDRHSPLLGEFYTYMEVHFPHFRENPYLPELPRGKKLVLRLLLKKRYFAISCLFRLRKG